MTHHPVGVRLCLFLSAKPPRVHLNFIDGRNVEAECEDQLEAMKW